MTRKTSWESKQKVAENRREVGIALTVVAVVVGVALGAAENYYSTTGD
jgi:hypothetical protein